MKLLVVDDHALIRDGVRGVVKDLIPDAVVLDASDCAQAARLLEQHPDIELVLLDLKLPDGDGFSLLSELRANRPATAVVMLAGDDAPKTIATALDQGALGFIPKSASRAVMMNALRLVLSGGIYVPPEILAREAPRQGQPAPRSPGDFGLTERQSDVLTFMLRGQSNKTIAHALDLAEPTVKNHVTAILKALKVTNRTEAVVAARQLGWLLDRAAGDGARVVGRLSAVSKEPGHDRPKRHRSHGFVE